MFTKVNMDKDKAVLEMIRETLIEGLTAKGCKYVSVEFLQLGELEIEFEKDGKWHHLVI